jgi:hypothetical protein
VIILIFFFLSMEQTIFAAHGGSSFPTAGLIHEDTDSSDTKDGSRRRASSSSSRSYHSAQTLTASILAGEEASRSSRSLALDDEREKVSVHSDEEVETETCMIPFSHVSLALQEKIKKMCDTRGWKVNIDVLSTERMAWEIPAESFEDFVVEAMGVVFEHDVQSGFSKIAGANKHRFSDAPGYLAMIMDINQGTVPLSGTACKSVATLARLSRQSKQHIDMFCEELCIYPASKKKIESYIRFRS